MKRKHVVFVLLFLILVGCANLGGKLTTIRSPGVDRIPTTICIHPLLSSPARRRYIIKEQLNVSREDDRVYIAPPTEARLAVTPQSQMLTGLLSSELAYYGFDLKELPVEIPEGSETEYGFVRDSCREDCGMLNSVWAVIREGKIELSEAVELPEGAKVLVTVLPAGESEFWLGVSQPSLSAVWDNLEDDVYARLLQR